MLCASPVPPRKNKKVPCSLTAGQNIKVFVRVSPVPPRKNKKVPCSLTAGQNIKVFVRVRPMNEIEKQSKSFSLVDCPTSKEVVVQERPLDKYTKKFAFDRVFDAKSKQIDIYKSVARPLVEEVLNGFNCTIFAYGQTGTGKTFTMEGDQFTDGLPIEENNNGAGIIPRCVNQLFDELRIQKLEFTMRVSFLELYNEELFDLLSAHDDLSKLRLYEDSTRKGSCIIQGLEEVLVRSKSDVYNIVNKGSAKRQTAATLMNAQSSRSHTVFTVTVHIKENTLEGDELLKTGKLHLVDLAGSENIGRSGAVDKRAREAGNINQSLLTLGRVITSLVEKAPHVPYRESKLTRLLQDALGGRTKTSIIATVSPASVNLEETLSTLDYAHRAKNIQNKPEVNQKLNKKELICEYTNEIEKLRRDLLAMREKNGVYLANENYQDLVSTMEQQALEISQKITEIRALESEMERQIELFSEVKRELETTNEKLQSTESNLLKTKEVLQCTQTLLSQTAAERDEQEHLVSAHVKTETELHNQGKKLINVAEVTTSDIHELHEKIDRKRKVEVLNDEVGKAFGREFEDRVSAMHSSVYAFKEYHHKNNSAVIGELGDYLSSTQGDSDAIVKQIKAMSASIIDSLQNSYHSLQQKVEKRRESSCAFADGIAANVLRENELLQGIVEDIVHPQFQQIMILSLQLQQTIEHHKENIESKTKAMTELCQCAHEKEKFLLDKMETRLSRLAEIPPLFALQISEKSRIMEERSKVHSKAMREMTRQLLEEMNAYDDALSVHFPLLTTEQNESLAEAECTSKELMCDVTTLSGLSLEHKMASLDFGKETRESLLDDAGKVSRLREESQQKISTLEERLEGGVSSTKNSLSHVITSAHKAKEGMASDFVDIQDTLKRNVMHISDEATAQSEATRREVLASMERTNIAVEELEEKLRRSESELDEFLTDHIDQIGESGECVQSLLKEQLAKDVPTGQTPIRKDYTFPQTLPATSPHERLLRRYRNRTFAATKIPIPSFRSDLEDESNVAGDSSSSTIGSDVSPTSETDRNLAVDASLERNFAQPLSRSGSFKEGQSMFTVPAAPLRQQSREDLFKQSNSLSRSSSTSSLTDSKENVSGNGRKLASTKKREIKQPTILISSASDKIATEGVQTRTRKVLGPYN